MTEPAGTPEEYRPDPLTPVLTRRWLLPESWTLRHYAELGGYEAMRQAFTMDPADLVSLVKERRTGGGLRLEAAAKGGYSGKETCIQRGKR